MQHSPYLRTRSAPQSPHKAWRFVDIVEEQELARQPMLKSTTLPIQVTNIIDLLGMRAIVLDVMRRIGCLVSNVRFSDSHAFRV